jgi:replication factor C large subunit
MLLFIKYAPKKLDDLIGNEDSRDAARRWILKWKQGKKQRPLLIHGPVGTGKTSMAVALAAEYELELIQMGVSDLRNKEHIERVFANAMTAESLSGKKKLLLIDDVDALQRADAGGSGAIAKLLRLNSCPIVLTAIDVWDQKLRGLRAECELVPLKRVSKLSIAKLLSKVNAAEKLGISDEAISALAEGANGDVRSALNDLQSKTPGLRDREKDIYSRVATLFKAATWAEAKKATQGDIDYDLLKLWVDENLPIEYTDANDLAKAFDVLSKADRFEGRIRGGNYWGYLKYTIDLISAGVALSKAKPYRSFVKYQFPKYLKEMGASKERRAMLKGIGKKIGKRVHANSKEALEYLHLIKHWAGKDQGRVMDLYEFTEEEMAFILETTVEDVKKRNGAMEKAKKMKEEPEEEEKPTKKVEKKEDKKEEKTEKKDEKKDDKKKKKSGTLMDFV